MNLSYGRHEYLCRPLAGYREFPEESWHGSTGVCASALCSSGDYGRRTGRRNRLACISRAQKGEPPIIRASLKELQKGWYQLSITVINRLPYQLFGVSLRRIRPRSARLMAPIISVSTKQGDFQVWSNPAVDKLTTTIPLDIALGAHEARQAGVLADSQTRFGCSYRKRVTLGV